MCNCSECPRFGEGEVEGEMERLTRETTYPQGFPRSVFCAPAPSAPAETLTLRPQGYVIPGVPVPFTESERAFLRALAIERLDASMDVVRESEATAAARALLAEEKK